VVRKSSHGLVHIVKRKIIPGGGPLGKFLAQEHMEKDPLQIFTEEQSPTRFQDPVNFIKSIIDVVKVVIGPNAAHDGFKSDNVKSIVGIINAGAINTFIPNQSQDIVSFMEFSGLLGGTF